MTGQGDSGVLRSCDDEQPDSPSASAGRGSQNKIELRTESKLESGSFKGNAKISTTTNRIKSGESMVSEYQFNNLGSERFYNPFFQGLIPNPAMLALFDSKGKCVGDLLCRDKGSWRRAKSDDWVFIPGGSFVGTKLGWKAGTIRCPQPGNDRNVPSGIYRVQLIFLNRFTYGKSSLEKPTPEPDWINDELFRSNVLEFEILDSEGKQTD